MRIGVLSGDDLSEVLALLGESGHEPVLVDGLEQALAFVGGMNQPHVVVTHHGDEAGREQLIRRLRGAGAWVLGVAPDPVLGTLSSADDLLPLPADAAALRARLLVADRTTTRVQLQARLLFSDRLRSVGTLAGGVAHEINNPLAVTLANLEFAIAELEETTRTPDLAETAQALREAREGAERVRLIVRDLHVFARSETDTRRALSVPKTVELALGVATHEMKHRARVVRDLADVPLVEANEQQLGQVVLNLLTNAAHAMPEGSANTNEIRVRTYLEQDRVVIEVADTGSGISPENLRRIFDPFFTTKPPGQGTGLGLAMCHTIIASIGGEIVVESTLGKGSTFRVLLPPAGTVPEKTPTPRPAGPPRRAKVLVVDDEPLIGRTVTRILAADHAVSAVASGAEALARIVDGGERFDVILCDLMMPDMTGMDLHAALGRLVPEQQARMIFVTGGAFTTAAQQFLERFAPAWLAKPFDAAKLKELIAAARLS